MPKSKAIRLAILGATDTRWLEVGPRLRDAQLFIDQTTAVDALACDAAILCSATDEGHGIERLLQSGKHVVLTADAGLTPARLHELADVATSAGVRLGVANPERYLPSRQLIRQQLDAGKLGAPGMVHIHRWEPAGLAAALCCDLDVILWYFGQMPNAVFALQQAAGDAVQVHLGFPDGGMALVDHVRRLPTGGSYYALSLIGATGAAYADDQTNVQLLYLGGAPHAIRAQEGVTPLAALAQDFVDAIAEGRDLSATISAWHHALALGDAVQRSLEANQATELRSA